MGFWIYMFIMDLLIPIIMILFVQAFLKKAPKENNYIFGYHIPSSDWSFDYENKSEGYTLIT